MNGIIQIKIDLIFIRTDGGTGTKTSKKDMEKT